MKCVLVTIAMISTLATIASVPLIHNGIGSEGEFQYIPKEDEENGIITVPVQINLENGGEYKLMEDEGVDQYKRAAIIGSVTPHPNTRIWHHYGNMERPGRFIFKRKYVNLNSYRG